MTRRDWLRASAWMPGWLIGSTVADRARVVAEGVYEAVAKVRYFRAERTIGELPTFWLTVDGATFTIMGDSKLPIVKWLAEQDGKTVRLRLEPRELERIAR